MKYKVTVTRESIECVDIVVEAANEDEANERALEEVANRGEELDWCTGPFTPIDPEFAVEEIEELEEVTDEQED